MNCKIISTAYTVDGTAFGAARLTYQCLTHGFSFDGPATLICPIGRIEDATDKALQAINDAKG